MAEPRESYGRCLGKRSFFDRFYELFLASDPAVPPMFEATDFERQKAALRHMLTAVVMFDDGNEFGAQSLARVARSHGPEGLDVPKHLYDRWLECLVQTVREHDPLFGPAVEEAWRRVTTRSIAFVLSQRA